VNHREKALFASPAHFARLTAWVGVALLLTTGCAQLPSLPLFSRSTNRAESKLALARLIEGQGQASQARAIYQSILQRDPSSGEAAHRMAILSSRDGKDDDAEKYFKLARAAQPKNADLLNDIGFWHYLHGRLPEAEATLRQALAIEPRHQAALNNLGLVVGRQGQLDKSLALFRQATDDAHAYQNLAFVCADLGKLDAAERYYHHALSLDAALKPAAEGLIQIAQHSQVEAAHLARAKRPPEAASPVRQADFVQPVKSSGSDD